MFSQAELKHQETLVRWAQRESKKKKKGDQFKVYKYQDLQLEDH